ncbi:2-aminoethylphosphonate--pyruvate transaminase [archaeon AH-315-M20]|nr:2-aminoethylphosphonate--pyruvate transaminase [archaeon AH-315-M20]
MKVKRNILLSPGPATTSDTVKLAQVVPDIPPREKEFGSVMKFVSEHLKKISGGDENYTCVLFGGSGTAGVDAVINSVVPPNKKILVINNGIYGERMVKIAKAYSISYIELKFEWGKLPDLQKIDDALQNDKNIACVSMIHHETTTGMLNPVREIGEIVKKHDKVFIVDTISSFACIPFSIKDYKIDFMLSTSNKCIQAMAGCCFAICKKDELEKIKDYPKRSFYLNLYDQYNFFKNNCQMQFTPPVQVIYALKQAIMEFEREGAKNRFERYLKSWQTLVRGMEELGFKRLLKGEEESHILTTFLDPENPNYDFYKIHDLLYKKGFTIYPGVLSKRATFRLANMGAINYKDIENFLKELRDVLLEMDIKLK